MIDLFVRGYYVLGVISHFNGNPAWVVLHWAASSEHCSEDVARLWQHNQGGFPRYVHLIAEDIHSLYS
jgi:hypothetical protein